MKLLKRLFILLISFSLLFLIGAIVFTVVIFDDQPLVLDITQPDPKSLIEAKSELERFIEGLNYRDHSKLALTHRQVDHLLSYLSQSFPVIKARYNYSETVLLAAASIELPDGPWENYLNISTELTDGNNLYVGFTKIGGITFSNRFLLNILFFSSSLFFDNELVLVAEKLLATASFTARGVNLNVGKEINSLLLVKKIKNELKKFRDLAWNNNQFSRVGFYYQYLSDFSAVTRGIDKVSLFDFIKPLFRQASNQRSDQAASSENADALIALALFVGDYRLKQFLSQITGFYSQQEPDLPDVLVSGRRDLMLHFIYSATFQVLSGRELSLAAGELKEILDMGEEGSGFSFGDLAADRAGVQFAIMATDRHGGDRHLQEFIAQANSEKSFIPDIMGLPDQLSYAEFEIDYQNTDSREYKIVVAEIDRRIRSLDLYKTLY